ncbi:hypothetical protein [Egicoccus halophilus]|uniref:Flagellar FliJ protein n=1 Tax=Egicoccus halophilus TaxID=1670830 RepID=A0A8J3AFF0_9ACTN|nr:hypothetical protein [Egicoccus halophilus]GGI06697.1 hypothetical protein GCM10011354_20390 [Egicoccus halophilus]
MKRDRMNVVLQVREGIERRRLAEQAAADLQVRLAGQRRSSAVSALEQRSAPTAFGSVGDLHQHRLGSLALTEAVERARDGELAARSQAEAADERRVQAAIARRSAQRLAERRGSEAAARASRAAESQLDAVALESWRRRP